jgi:tripartite-type tricarboxylate transporter receptor subunit TctC
MLAVSSVLSLTGALAADYPSKPITIIVPFPPGGTADAQARLLAKGLAERMGKPVVVDNRPGAGGRIGAGVAARAAPDGHTILMGSVSTLAIEPSLHMDTTYDPQRDFAPVCLISEMPFVLVAAPSVPVTTVAELLAYARQHPGQLTFGSWGLGTSSHLVMEMLKYNAKVDLLHVPYKSGVAAMTDMVAGRISLLFAVPVDSVPLIKAGKLRALAVTSARRLPVLPDVPTLSEVGVPAIDLQVWFGLVVPAKTPADIANRLRSEVTAVVKSTEFGRWLENQGGVAIEGGAETLSKRMQTDAALAAKIAKTISLKLDE